MSAEPSMISDLALDLIIETLISSPDPHRRALVVHNLVEEIVAVVAWLGPEEAGAELLSFGQVLAAACAHRERMEQEQLNGREPRRDR